MQAISSDVLSVWHRSGRGRRVLAAVLFCAAALMCAQTQAGEFTTYEVLSAKDAINGLPRAQKLLEGEFSAGASTTQQTPVVNFQSTDERRRLGFPGALPFPVDPPGDHLNLAMNITADVDIPTAGTWSFGVNSVGGFRLSIDGNSMQRNGLGAGDKIAPFTFDQAGTYALDLTYYQHGTGGQLELFDAEGRFHRFRARGASWNLVGAANTGGLSLSALSDAVTPLPPDLGNVSPFDAAPDISAVPEPAGLAMLSIAAPWLLRRQRRPS
jgi:hypothetical protein